MNKKIVGIFIVILLMATTLQTVGSIKTEFRLIYKQDDIYDRIIECLMNYGHFPSISACIIKDDNVVWSNSYGLRDIENNYQATDNTIYEIASITKTITGTALMQLYDEGLFDLDDDVNIFLPFSLRNPNFPDTPITFRMLLSHSSSIVYTSYWDYMPSSLEDYEEWYPDPFLKDYLAPDGSCYNSEAWSPDYSPGEVCSYANINFEIVSYLVQLISGQHFVEYCNENIFIPLEMWNTSFYIEDLDREQIATPYIWNYNTGKFDSALFYYPEWLIPGIWSPVGGLFTSVIDLSHFMIAHMNGGVYNGVRILEADTIEEMHTIHPSSPRYTGYGLAWLFHPRIFIVGKIGLAGFNHIYSGHGGDMMGYQTFMYKKVSENIAVIYFINTDKIGDSRISNAAELLKEVLFLKAGQY
jgi:CubicO group peptidase (beta-lactamase class C family)